MVNRAAVVIIHAGCVALIERRTPARGTYYVFPGGGIEPGETPEATAAREAWEELGLRVTVGRCIAEVTRAEAVQYHFLAVIAGGMFGTGTGDEMTGATAPDAGTYTPIWLPLAKLTIEPVFPRRFAALVADTGAGGAWPPMQRFADEG